MSRQFQRPVEYDPSLVAAAQAAQRNRETALKNDFGFESDGEASGGSDEEEDERPQKKTHRKSSAADEAAYGLEEFERLAEALQQANEARAIAEANAMKAEERVAELQAMSKSAKQILVAKFREQIKTLQDQVGEQKQMLTEDDELLEEMRHKLAVAEAGGEDADMAVVEAKVKEFKDIRELQRENASLKYKVEELSQTAKHTQDELNETKKELDKVKPKGGDDPASLLAKIEKLESERTLLRDELKKRHLERSKLVATISQMKEAKENGEDTMDDLDLPTSATPAPTSTPLDSAEKQQLLTKIKTLEEALKNAKTNGTSTPIATSAPDGKDKEALEEMVKKMDGLMKRREEEMKVWKEKAKEKLTTASNTIKKLKSEYDVVKMANTKLKTEGSISGEMKRQLQTAAAKRKVIISRAQKQTGEVKKSLDALRAQVGSIPETVAAFGPLISQAMKAAANKGQSELMHVKDSLKKEMALRKQLFNAIQELKGNIRVYCRVRPMSSKEQAEHTDGQVISFPTDNELEVFNPEKKVSHNFEFEQIFDPTKNQEQVFEEVKDLVTSVLDGFNVCIFAYGQTGTGKTFTMQGPKDNPGVNTRALQRLFEQCAERLPDFKYDIQVTLLEIYNEKIMDLLNSKAQEPLKAIQGANGMEVQGLTYVPVSSLKDVLDVLARGSKNRHVQQTNMNADSSRSHLILSVYVQGVNTVTNKQFVGKLHLIDLAGSERISRSGVQGEALKEAQNINQSLSALGNCIAARANKNAHVPYRDSSLTYLLQDSLEKNSKTLMFVQISPSKFDVSETLCSLKFAARVRTVELGKASKNEVKAGSAKTPVKK